MRANQQDLQKMISVPCLMRHQFEVVRPVQPNFHFGIVSDINLPSADCFPAANDCIVLDMMAQLEAERSLPPNTRF